MIQLFLREPSFFLPFPGYSLRMKFSVLLFFAFLSGFGHCQSGFIAEGKVMDAVSQTPVPFARVFNKTTGKGTITSEEGYFRMAVSSVNDSIELKIVGYKTRITTLKSGFNTVLLEPNAKDLSEVEIKVKDDSPLFELLEKCSKYHSNDETGKGYYLLSSYMDTSQVELVENYYNLQLKAYDVKSLELKAGRLALQTFNDRFFTSQASSQAISQLKTFGKNDFFPQTPLNLKAKEAKKLFRLEVLSAYKDENRDSVYVIKYKPRINTVKNFEGRIWVNVTQSVIGKITMNCSDCEVHPFLPIFPTDSVKNVEMRITKTFAVANDHPVFNHIDFRYRVNYISRPGKMEERRYAVETKAVLFAYDLTSSFSLPAFVFEKPINDYRKINAFPYNPFFWDENNEFDLNNQDNRNEAFFKDPASITNGQFFKSSNVDWKNRDLREKKSGYLEHPYIHWSGNRVFLREVIDDTITKSALGKQKSLMYNLNVQLFLDVNTYGDSLNILTETVFDPYETYYYLPIDVYANCFINMYFDLCEIQRRKLDQQLRSIPEPTPEKIRQAYDLFMLQAKKEQELFLKEVDRGTVKKAMEKWNSYILQELGNDNLGLFGVEYGK